jgi:hypothetical protein
MFDDVCPKAESGSLLLEFLHLLLHVIVDSAIDLIAGADHGGTELRGLSHRFLTSVQQTGLQFVSAFHRRSGCSHPGIDNISIQLTLGFYQSFGIEQFPEHFTFSHL